VVHGHIAGASAVCTSSAPPLVLGSRLLVLGGWSGRGRLDCQVWCEYKSLAVKCVLERSLDLSSV
jgi:hypothetical protein